GLGVTLDISKLKQVGGVTQPGRQNFYRRPDGSLTHWEDNRISMLASAFVVLATFGPGGGTHQVAGPLSYDVRTFGARGDGRPIDSQAINNAIAAAAAAGGGIVDLPAGQYLSFSIRLKSHVTLRLNPGAVLVAGDPASGLGQYDLPEPNAA